MVPLYAIECQQIRESSHPLQFHPSWGLQHTYYEHWSPLDANKSLSHKSPSNFLVYTMTTNNTRRCAVWDPLPPSSVHLNPWLHPYINKKTFFVRQSLPVKRSFRIKCMISCYQLLQAHTLNNSCLRYMCMYIYLKIGYTLIGRASIDIYQS